jgi:uncharacterized membrane protein YkoI
MMKPRILGIVLALIGAPAIANADDRPAPKEKPPQPSQTTPEGEDISSDDKQVQLENVPKQAKATIEKQIAGGTLTEIEEETRANQTVYEVEYRDAKNQRFELVVADDGKLLDKRRD